MQELFLRHEIKTTENSYLQQKKNKHYGVFQVKFITTKFIKVACELKYELQ